MTKILSPETPIAELTTSTELFDFANHYEFENIKEMLATGFNELHKLAGFDYRLQREIVNLLQQYHWEDLLEQE